MLSIHIWDYIFPIVVILLAYFLYFTSRYSDKAKQLLYGLVLIITFIYLIWRTFFTIPTTSGFGFSFGLLLLITEWIGYFQMFVFYLLVWKPFKRRHIPMKEHEKLPTVDVFIATYNEPAKILKKTVAACSYLKYPKDLLHVYICDDGNREEIKKLAEEFAIGYIARADNSHAKAGNLNYALRCTKGEIIVTLDADMIPKSIFLERTIGQFVNPKVSFVQAPQVFYNPDPFQYNLFSETNIPNEQDFFMRHLEQGKDRYDAVMYVGSNALFRRESLKTIGGFATGVITEDMATGMLLQSKNYQSVFVNEALAVGLSTESWSDLLKQRDRWCRGNIQCARKWNPLTYHGLSFMQKILYFDGIVYWFFGVYKMIYILAPILFLVFGVYVLEATLTSILIFWLPSYVTSVLAFSIASRKQRNFMWSHVYETAMAPYMAFSALSELFLKKKFNFHVTRKGVLEGSRIFRWQLALPHFLLMILTIVGIIKFGFAFYSNNDILLSLYVINLFWAFYNLIAIVASILIAFDRPRYRESERSNIHDQCFCTINDVPNIPCTIMDISETGARIELRNFNGSIELGSSLDLCVKEIQDLKAKIVWLNKNNQLKLGVRFTDLTTTQYTQLVKIIYDKLEAPYNEEKTIRSLITYSMFNFFRHTKKTPKRYK